MQPSPKHPASLSPISPVPYPLHRCGAAHIPMEGVDFLAVGGFFERPDSADYVCFTLPYQPIRVGTAHCSLDDPDIGTEPTTPRVFTIRPCDGELARIGDVISDFFPDHCGKYLVFGQCDGAASDDHGRCNGDDGAHASPFPGPRCPAGVGPLQPSREVSWRPAYSPWRGSYPSRLRGCCIRRAARQAGFPEGCRGHDGIIDGSRKQPISS